MSRFLDRRAVTIEVDDSLRVDTNSVGSRTAWRGTRAVGADEGDGQMASVARMVIAIREREYKSIAMIGGGFCILPRVLGQTDIDFHVYEIEPALSIYCPAWCRFIPGDWRDTLTGQFDVIVYDIGGEVPRGTLSKFLAPGGVILPKED